MSLLTIAGASFMGTHGVAERFMDSLATVGVNAPRELGGFPDLSR